MRKQHKKQSFANSFVRWNNDKRKYWKTLLNKKLFFRIDSSTLHFGQRKKVKFLLLISFVIGSLHFGQDDSFFKMPCACKYSFAESSSRISEWREIRFICNVTQFLGIDTLEILYIGLCYINAKLDHIIKLQKSRSSRQERDEYKKSS